MKAPRLYRLFRALASENDGSTTARSFVCPRVKRTPRSMDGLRKRSSRFPDDANKSGSTTSLAIPNSLRGTFRALQSYAPSSRYHTAVSSRAHPTVWFAPTERFISQRSLPACNYTIRGSEASAKQRIRAHAGVPPRPANQGYRSFGTRKGSPADAHNLHRKEMSMNYRDPERSPTDDSVDNPNLESDSSHCF